MKLTVKEQYALMLAFYLQRAGRSTIFRAAVDLNVSTTLLQQVGLAMKRGGVIQSVRGPGGGYQLNGEPTVRQVLNAVKLLPTINTMHNDKSLKHVFNLFSAALDIVYRRKIKNLYLETTLSDPRLTLGTKAVGVMN